MRGSHSDRSIHPFDRKRADDTRFGGVPTAFCLDSTVSHKGKLSAGQYLGRYQHKVVHIDSIYLMKGH